MSNSLHQFDSWLSDGGPVALVIREHLMPVEGSDGVLFPATFAAGDKFDGGYNIDTFCDGKNVCLVDSVGSQANRIEPLFAREGYAALIPQIVVKAGEKDINILDAGHRAGDAIVRCSSLQAELREAFLTVMKGNAEPLAKIAPTSLVFGVWDSRDTQAKLPRLISSTIRAFDVKKLTRSAQFVPAAEYVAAGLLDEPADKKESDLLAKRGYIHVPASASHGGVIAQGGIRRDATLSLAALRLLSAGADNDKTLTLRRYILGLALTALTYSPSGYLRQGCNLVIDADKQRVFDIVHGDGRRDPANVSHDQAKAFAAEAAKAFGVGSNRSVEFDKSLALRDISGEAADSGKPRKKATKKAT